MALRLLFREKASILATSGSGMRQVDPPSRNAQRPPGIASQDITLNPLNRRQEERCSDSGFLELPFDVLLEIFSLLEPVDLLHLSSASRYLLRLLRSDDTLYIWTSVRFFSCLSPTSIDLLNFSFSRLTQIYLSPPTPKCPDNVNISIIPTFSMVYIVRYVPIDVI